MTAFLKIDRCKVCQQERPWEWVPPILSVGKVLAGIGIWRSQLVDSVCPRCLEVAELKRKKAQRDQALRESLIGILGGEKPYRKFTFERYQVTPGNQLAFEKAKRFDPSNDNLYFWGPCGVGKTHLAHAMARMSYEQGRSIAVQLLPQLVRKLRMKSPDEEKQAIEGFVRVNLFVLDDLGLGHETAFARQVLQEILDAWDFKDHAGLVVTSKFSLGGLA